MVDITITADNVVAGASSKVDRGQAGVLITAGQLVYEDSTTKKYALVDTNHANVEARRPKGIALNRAVLNQPVAVLTSGDITVGGTLVAGTAYYASDAPGGICPVADVGVTEAVALIGLAKSTSVLSVGIQFPGVTL